MSHWLAAADWQPGLMVELQPHNLRARTPNTPKDGHTLGNERSDANNADSTNPEG